MKKIFTLIAVAAMAISANAQGTYKVAADDTFSSDQEITSVTGVKCTLGSDTWANGKAYDGLTGWDAYTQGSANPDPEVGTGGCVIFEPTVAGKLSIGVKVNKGSSKSLFVNDGSSDTSLADSDASNAKYTTVEFDVVAGKKYTVYQKGSKFCFFGFTFATSSAVAGIAEAKAEAAAPVKVITAKGIQIGKYNVAGQQVK